jgi:hypothetical protein
MTRENWLWMQASVSLIAAAAVAMRRAAAQAKFAQDLPDALLKQHQIWPHSPLQ